MRSIACPACASAVFVESLTCMACGTEIGFHPPSQSFVAIEDGEATIDGTVWVACSNRSWKCNWLASTAEPSAQCFSCRLTRRRPDNNDTIALEKLAATGIDKRRLLMQLMDLGLPITPYFEKEGGLAFDLLSSLSGERVSIGHANGVITIDLAETLDERREALRVRLGEAYRTMLGHFRHEIGHYYQGVLLDTDELWNDCRALFGDERISYADAITRHYREGAPSNWIDSFISEYATMHPWEDFAECFAHYLHITGTLATMASAGVLLQAEKVDGHLDADIEPSHSYRDRPIGDILDDWFWLSTLFNRVNRTMGMRDLYPFGIVEPVVAKLAFIHRIVVRASAGESDPHAR